MYSLNQTWFVIVPVQFPSNYLHRNCLILSQESFSQSYNTIKQLILDPVLVSFSIFLFQYSGGHNSGITSYS